MFPAAEIAKIMKITRSLSAGKVLRDIAKEVLSVKPLISEWIQVPASGSATCHYNRYGMRRYSVRYQSGNVGNLVHELTHVLVNESYGLDFINYAHFSAVAPVQIRDSQNRCLNEQERQTRVMDHSANDEIITILQSLQAWANAADFGDLQRKSEVNNKLVYAIMNPQKEFDTVINQIFVWLYEWDFPIPPDEYMHKPPVNAFYDEIEKVAKKNYLSRTTLRPTITNNPKSRIHRPVAHLFTKDEQDLVNKLISVSVGDNQHS